MMIANALTEAKEPLVFLTVMMVFFTASYLVGWFTSRIPFFKWVPLVAWGLHAYKYPLVMQAWELPIFYLFWGLIAANLMYFRKKLFKSREYDYSVGSSISFPRFRSPNLGIGAGIGAIFRGVGALFRYTGKAIKETFYFILITIPCRLIRLGFWLKVMIPKLTKINGWWLLMKGLFQWFLQFVPFEIRSEFSAGLHGKSVKDSFREGIKAEFEKAKAKQRRREEEELRRMFRKVKRVFKNEAKAGRNPFENTQSQDRSYQQYKEQAHKNDQSQSRRQSGNSTSGSNDSPNSYWNDQKRRAEEAKQKRDRDFKNAKREEEEAKRAKSSKKTKSRSQSESKNQEDNSRKKKKRQSDRTKQRDSSSYSSKQSSRGTQGQQTTSSNKLFSEVKLSPLSKEYFYKYKEDFDLVGWEYDSSEERFTENCSHYKILNVSSTATNSEIKKAWTVLLRQYARYSNAQNPTPVQNRHHEISCVINRAKDTLIRPHKQNQTKK